MTASPNGLSPIEAAVLTTLADLGATPDRPHRKTAYLLGEMEQRHAIWPAVAFAALLPLVRPGATDPLLVDGHGNFGTPWGDAPANPRYTEVRLSPMGAQAARAEQGGHPPLPLGLVLGNQYAAGRRPPFAPARVVDALLALRADPGLDDHRLHALLGPPTYASGCAVDGPIDALLAGRPVSLELQARIAQPRPGVLEITNPPDLCFDLEGGQVPPSEVVLRRYRHARNESWGGMERYVVELAPGVDAVEEIGRLRSLWPLAAEVEADLGAPWRHQAEAWLAAVAGVDDLAGHLRLLITAPAGPGQLA